MISTNINKITFSLLECQVEIILRSLELYAFNLHYTYSLENDDFLNTMIYHTYEGILSSYSKNQYRIGYNVPKECCNRSSQLKKRNFYKNKKNIA